MSAPGSKLYQPRMVSVRTEVGTVHVLDATKDGWFLLRNYTWVTTTRLWQMADEKVAAGHPVSSVGED